jgi:hypothetical protein
MTAEEVVDQGKNLSFEKVWSAMMEADRKMAELVARIAEQSWAAIQKRVMTDDELRELEKKGELMCGNAGGLNRSLGELIETFAAAHLWENFPQYGLERACQRILIYDETKRVRTDVDILLVDTGICMAVEVKRELNRRDDVDDHVRRMELIRQYPPEQVSGKQLLGAMAGGVVDPDIKDYAYKCGFYVLELSGEVVSLIPPPQDFEPQNW